MSDEVYTYEQVFELKEDLEHTKEKCKYFLDELERLRTTIKQIEEKHKEEIKELSQKGWKASIPLPPKDYCITKITYEKRVWIENDYVKVNVWFAFPKYSSFLVPSNIWIGGEENSKTHILRYSLPDETLCWDRETNKWIPYLSNNFCRIDPYWFGYMND